MRSSQESAGAGRTPIETLNPQFAVELKPIGKFQGQFWILDFGF
jgi:hypothetical protein